MKPGLLPLMLLREAYEVFAVTAVAVATQTLRRPPGDADTHLQRPPGTYHDYLRHAGLLAAVHLRRPSNN